MDAVHSNQDEKFVQSLLQRVLNINSIEHCSFDGNVKRYKNGVVRSCQIHRRFLERSVFKGDVCFDVNEKVVSCNKRMEITATVNRPTYGLLYSRLGEGEFETIWERNVKINQIGDVLSCGQLSQKIVKGVNSTEYTLYEVTFNQEFKFASNVGGFVETCQKLKQITRNGDGCFMKIWEGNIKVNRHNGQIEADKCTEVKRGEFVSDNGF